MTYDGKERRKDMIEANEKVVVLETKFKSMEDKLDILQNTVNEIKNVLIPTDGSPSIPEKIRTLENFKKQLVAIWVFVAGTVVHFVLGVFK